LASDALRTRPESQDCYGYGWALGDLAGQPARYHTGDNPGFRAINAWLTDLDAYVIVLSNQESTDPHQCATELLATVLN
jgi:Beta-lactamase